MSSGNSPDLKLFKILFKHLSKSVTYLKEDKIFKSLSILLFSAMDQIL
jgi:hypothetical protein